jgi:serine/threonine protein kinase
MTLKDAITKINDELGQRIGEPITIIGAFISTQLTSEIVDGVHYLHSLKPPIVHRDLKPSNIFIIDGRGGKFIKIGDMGSAIFHKNRDSDGDDDDTLNLRTSTRRGYTRLRGTVGYMAPEVGNSTEYDEKCDAYSLGCIMMDLFCIRKAHDSM